MKSGTSISSSVTSSSNEIRRRGDAIVGTSNHQGLALIVKPFQYSDFSSLISHTTRKSEGGVGQPKIILGLDGITDPHNLGAIVRSADGAGVYGCILPSKYSAPITPVAIKASAGALESMPIAKVPRVSETLKHCKQHGWNIVGTAVPATARYTDLVYSGPTIIVIGSEGEGLHPSVKAQCDVLVEIPMHGAVASLNASVAAGIVLFQARAQRLSLQHSQHTT